VNQTLKFTAKEGYSIAATENTVWDEQ